MDLATAHRRLRDARVARLATVTPAGRPHLVPCCFVVTGEPAGPAVAYSAVDAKPKSTPALQRLANLRRDPAASLLADRYDEDWDALWWVRVDGRARVLDDGDERDRAIERLRVKYPQYRRTPPPGPVIALDIATWRSWSTTGR